MTARRLPEGGEVDRSRPLSFTFDGRPVQGFHGDTLASALLASGERVLGRSFKYRRPRGIWGAGTEEPNVYADATDGPRFHPNLRVTLEPARDGLALRSANSSPSARADRLGFLDLFARFLPSAFYYKTFFWPNWQLYEPAIRRMAGLGRITPSATPVPDGDQRNHHCDTVVVGAGPVGIAAALGLSRSGESVVLVDDGSRIGGSLLFRTAQIDGMPGANWLAAAEADLRQLGVTVLTRTTAFGIYDHGLIALNQRRDDSPDRLWRVRPRRIVLAEGAVERPLPFAANDLPGVMSAEAALSYLRRQAVLPGLRIVVATNNSSTDEVAAAMTATGAEVTVVDARQGRRVARALGLTPPDLANQVWVAQGWRDRFGLPYDAHEIGYGHSAAQVGAFSVGEASLLLGYHADVHRLTLDVLDALADGDLERIVDERWDPPVTAAVRLVSVVNDTTQHLGQAAYAAGVVRRR